MLIAAAIVFVVLNSCNCVPVKTPDALQNDINTIKNELQIQKVATDHLNQIYTSLEPKISSSMALVTAINSNVNNIQERAHVWDTLLHHVTSWNDQLTVADRKLDIISKGHEFSVSKLENTFDTVSSLEFKLENISNKISRLEEIVSTQKVHSSDSCLFGDFATRGILSSLKAIEIKLNSRKENNSSYLEILADIASKVDAIYDRAGSSSETSDEDRSSDIYACKGINKVLETLHRIGNTTLEEKVSSSPTKQSTQLESTSEKQEEQTSNTSPSPWNDISNCESAPITGFYNNNSLYCVVDHINKWTVIQRRIPMDLQEDFSRSWEEYKEGFGNVNGEFWIGNEVLHNMSNTQDLVLRIELENVEGTTAWAEYLTFSIGSENDNYRLKIGRYQGNASDSFSDHNEAEFSTYDRKNDDAPSCCPCAVSYGGGWWFMSCFYCNLNGVYLVNPEGNGYRGIIWETWLGDYSLRKSKMMVRRRNTGDTFINPVDDP